MSVNRTSADILRHPPAAPRLTEADGPDDAAFAEQMRLLGRAASFCEQHDRDNEADAVSWARSRLRHQRAPQDGSVYVRVDRVLVEQMRGDGIVGPFSRIRLDETGAEPSLLLVVGERPAIAQTLESLLADLAECYRLTGADPDGNEDWRLAPRAVAEVRRLRAEHDAAETAIDAMTEQLGALMTELVVTFEPLMGHIHRKLHADAGAYETCAQCQPIRLVLEEAKQCIPMLAKPLVTVTP